MAVDVATLADDGRRGHDEVADLSRFIYAVKALLHAVRNHRGTILQT